METRIEEWLVSGGWKAVRELGHPIREIRPSSSECSQMEGQLSMCVTLSAGRRRSEKPQPQNGKRRLQDLPISPRKTTKTLLQNYSKLLAPGIFIEVSTEIGGGFRSTRHSGVPGSDQQSQHDGRSHRPETDTSRFTSLSWITRGSSSSSVLSITVIIIH